MIYFVRHGETDYNLKRLIQGRGINVSLNETGRLSAEKARENLRGVSLDKIYSSPLLRAKETAEIINKDFDLEIVCDDRLIEVGVGEREGTTWESWSKEQNEAFWDNPAKFGAETPAEVFERVGSFFDEHKNSNENILIVSHAGVYKYLYRTIHGITDVRKDISAPKNAEIVIIK